MSVRVAVETEQCFTGLALELVALGLNIPHFHIDTSAVNAECRNVSVTVEWDVFGVRRHIRVAHYAVESAINLIGEFAENHEVTNFTFETAREA